MSNRSITFTIPAKLGLGVQVTVVENENGNLDFTVDVPGSGNHAADLRGLFFHLIDESDLAGGAPRRPRLAHGVCGQDSRRG